MIVLFDFVNSDVRYLPWRFPKNGMVANPKNAFAMLMISKMPYSDSEALAVMCKAEICPWMLCSRCQHLCTH